MRRRLAYSCWSTASGARVNNYGSRIDLILAADADSAQAGPCGVLYGSPAAAGRGAGAASGPAEERRGGAAYVPVPSRGSQTGCALVTPGTCSEEWSTAQGNGAAQTRSELAAGGEGPGSGSGFHGCFTGADVWAEAQGSDHAPVWADLVLPQLLPRAPALPLLSTRFMFTGAHLDISTCFDYVCWHGAATPSPLSIIFACVFTENSVK